MSNQSMPYELVVPSDASALLLNKKFIEQLEAYRKMCIMEKDMREFIYTTWYLVECWMTFSASNCKLVDVNGVECVKIADFLKYFELDILPDFAYLIHRTYRVLKPLGDIYMREAGRFTWVCFAPPHSCLPNLWYN